MTNLDPRVRAFRELHRTGCFVIPNPWDAGSAVILERLGFSALATTSAGFAWSLGRRDNGVTLDEMLAHLSTISANVTVPVNADFERGFAIEPNEVAANVAKAVETGIAGLSIEDSTHEVAHPLFDVELAVERVRAARRAIDESGRGVLLTGRCEGFIEGRPDLGETIRRLVAYGEAGAECVYAPGIRSIADMATLVREVAPLPVNALAFGELESVARLADVGVRRVSAGGSLARTAWTGFLDAARELKESGTFVALGRAVSGKEMNGMFASND